MADGFDIPAGWVERRCARCGAAGEEGCAFAAWNLDAGQPTCKTLRALTAFLIEVGVATICGRVVLRTVAHPSGGVLGVLYVGDLLRYAFVAQPDQPAERPATLADVEATLPSNRYHAEC